MTRKVIQLKILQLIKQNFDSLHERLTYVHGLWESNFSRFTNTYDLQNEIDEHWEPYEELDDLKEQFDEECFKLCKSKFHFRTSV